MYNKFFWLLWLFSFAHGRSQKKHLQNNKMKARWMSERTDGQRRNYKQSTKTSLLLVLSLCLFLSLLHSFDWFECCSFSLVVSVYMTLDFWFLFDCIWVLPLNGASKWACDWAWALLAYGCVCLMNVVLSQLFFCFSCCCSCCCCCLLSDKCM